MSMLWEYNVRPSIEVQQLWYYFVKSGSYYQTNTNHRITKESFTFIKKLLSSFLLSTVSVVSSAYLRLLRFLPVVFIPTCVSSSPAFFMMYSAYKLNKQGDNIQPWRIPFPVGNQFLIWNKHTHCFMSSSNCYFLTCIQISQEDNQVVSYSHLFKDFHSLLGSTQSKALV